MNTMEDLGQELSSGVGTHHSSSRWSTTPASTTTTPESGSNDNTVWLWRDGQCTATLTGHTGGVYCLAVFPDGSLASGSKDETVKLWNKDGVCIHTLRDFAVENVVSQGALSE